MWCELSGSIQGDTESGDNKMKQLKYILEKYTLQDCIVAFSGGVDSALLLKMTCAAAVRHGKKVYAVTMQTRLHPIEEIAHAKAVAEEIGADHVVITVDELEEAGIEKNPTDRCYRCKKYLFARILEKAKELQVGHVLEGTNADDLQMYRPGLKALRELGIHSPLAEAGLTKGDVRKLSKEYGLSVSERPAMPCLATRFPYGTRLSYEEMERVEKGEAYLRARGFYNVRLRIHGDIVRMEVDEQSLERVIQERKEMISYLKELGFGYITLDLEGFRSGSMDVYNGIKTVTVKVSAL